MKEKLLEGVKSISSKQNHHLNRKKLERILSRYFPIPIDEEKTLDKKYESEYGWKQFLNTVFHQRKEVPIEQVLSSINFGLENKCVDSALTETIQILKHSCETGNQSIITRNMLQRFFIRICKKHKLSSDNNINEKTTQHLLKIVLQRCSDKTDLEQLQELTQVFN